MARPVDARPTPEHRFNPAPGWPIPPQGWAPPSGWQPDPSWPASPQGWDFWLPAQQQPPHAADTPLRGPTRGELRPRVGRGRNVGIGLSGFLAVVLGGFGLILVALAPGAQADVAAAQVLLDRGVPVPLATAAFTTQVVPATRAVGTDSCQLSTVDVTFSLDGTEHTDRLGARYTTSDQLPTCGDVLAAAADDYPTGTMLLVDPQNPTLVGVAADVPTVARDTAYSGQLRAVGVTLLVFAGVAGVVLALLLRCRRPDA